MTYLASSAGALITDRNAWHTRADQAWGSSRVWNSGTSFESALATMTADRNAWQTNANNAWGLSRVYGSGESWEAAYNRVLPPATSISALATFNGQMVFSGARYQVNLSWSGSPNTTYFGAAVGGLTCKIAGQYSIRASVKGGYGMELEIRRNGVSLFVDTSNADVGSAYASCPPASTSGLVAVAANDVLTVWQRNLNGTFGGTPSVFEVVFIPNQTNPH